METADYPYDLIKLDFCLIYNDCLFLSVSVLIVSSI